MALLYLMIRGVMIRYIGWGIEREITHKKKTLANLILMKDIQTELEKEIEQAILKAAFHT
jgi:UV DNA damage repair endonuclease